ncbi:DeoR/GlpR family DNA-binding transcription regulator [Treponema phagedenis]|nr:DeoR/GlpR family DNA-binding transcription regulator [Treponema phagedenis]CEM63166.1 Transcriptional regulator, DeoR family [Treponema phagedenis]
MRTTRLEDIENFIYANRTVSLDRLCEEFSVSKNTIRRDIDEIVKSGKIEKIYGGVRLIKENIPLLPFTDRNVKNLAVKKQIAQVACDYVKDKDIIFIDSGTTTCHMIEWLQDKEITVITNNLEFLVQSVSYPKIRVFSLSGELNRNTLSFTGIHTLNILKEYNIAKAFMAATGISAKAGVTNTVPAESAIKQLVISRSQQVFLLVDSSKFNQVSMVTYAEFADIDRLITDKPPTGALLKTLKQNYVDITRKTKDETAEF